MLKAPCPLVVRRVSYRTAIRSNRSPCSAECRVVSRRCAARPGRVTAIDTRIPWISTTFCCPSLLDVQVREFYVVYLLESFDVVWDCEVV